MNTKKSTTVKRTLSEKKIAALMEVHKKFSRTGRMWETGYPLPRITEAIAEAIGDAYVQIHVPYATFVCRGKATDVDSDVKGLMPFSKTRKSEESCTTLFYGDKKITRGNYIPFQGGCDVYHITSINVTDGCVDVQLEKGNNSAMFM